ncbi:hypothetical protein BT69DRAFT_1275890 [Atractiella rhizophila]|nr:hypothetical protein BT69DRAFT_1275890 [Atractiella rhizophila]
MFLFSSNTSEALGILFNEFFSTPSSNYTFFPLTLQLSIFFVFVTCLYAALIYNLFSFDDRPSKTAEKTRQKPFKGKKKKRKTSSNDVEEEDETAGRMPKNFKTVVWHYLRECLKIVPEEASASISKAMGTNEKISSIDIVTLPVGSYTPVWKDGVEILPSFRDDTWVLAQECQCGFTSTDRRTLLRHIIHCDMERRKQIPAAQELPLARIAKWLTWRA